VNIQPTMTIGDIINLLLVGTLVATTIWYTVRTHGLWQEAKMTRQFQQPSLRLSPKGTFFPGVGVVNVGNGYALDIRLVYQQVGTPACCMTFSIPVLAPGASYDVPVQTDGERAQWTNISKDELVVQLEGTCRDSVGNEVVVRHSVSLTEFVRQAEKVDTRQVSLGQTDSEQRYRQEVVSELRDIARALGGGPFGRIREMRSMGAQSTPEESAAADAPPKPAPTSKRSAKKQ
jgi:hypothetical protein